MAVEGTAQSSDIADLNRDGIPDIVVAAGTKITLDSSGNYGLKPEGVAVLLGKGNRAFQAPEHYATVGSVTLVFARDINGDGIPDLLALATPTDPSDHGALNVLHGNGDGSFAAPVTYPINGYFMQSMFPADVNGDGSIDLVVSTSPVSAPNRQDTAILLNDGHGNFRLGQQIAGASPLGVADLNGDGKLDLVMSELTYSLAEFPTLTLYIYAGAGDGTFAQVGPAYPRGDAGHEPLGAAIADFNEDGHLDLAITYGMVQLLLMLGDGTGKFTPANTVTKLDPMPVAIHTGDYNHDGHADLSLLGSSFGDVSILFGHGDGSFAFRDMYGAVGRYGGGSLNQADMNDDGYLDMITTNGAGWVSIMYGKPGGTFNASATYALGTFYAQATVTGDFTGDGILDIAVLNYGAGSVSVMQGRGNGLFVPLQARYKSGSIGEVFAAGDVNRDGKMDLLVGQAIGAQPTPFGLLLGNGDGTFQPSRIIPHICDSGTTQLFLVDVNRDGKLDAVTNCGVSLGNGDATFAPTLPFFKGDAIIYRNRVALADFNKDGKLDLLVADASVSPSISIFPGDDTGQFSTVASYRYNFPPGTQPDEIAIGRFTRDGNVGVVAGSHEQMEFPSVRRLPYGSFTLFTGNGNGTLTPRSTFQLMQDLVQFAVADFNGDGADDVAVFDYGSTSYDVQGIFGLLSLYVSAGNGNLLPPVQFGETMGGISMGDFNNDGAIDLAGAKPQVGAGVIMNSNGTSVRLSAAQTSVAVGQSITLDVTVTPSFRFSGALSGSVDFYDNGVLFNTSTLSEGSVTVSTPALSKGTHAFTARFSGNANFNPHGSNSVIVVAE